MENDKVTNKSYEELLKDWEHARFAPPPEQTPTPSSPTLIEMAPMRDGVGLYTEIYLPDTRNSFPTVLIRSPYPMFRPSRDDKWPVSRYLDAGYAFVFQLTRGQYKSEGRFRFHLDDVEDGYDCINWLEAQHWCDGNVGMEGSSYSGKTQLQAARNKPRALKCIMPTAQVGNFVTCFPFMGGIPARAWWLQWHRLADAESMADLDAIYGDMSLLHHSTWGPAFRKRPLIDAADQILTGDKLSSWRDSISHPQDDEYWQAAHFSAEELAGLELPMFFTAGWLDLTLGAIDDFEKIERLQPMRDNNYLLVGPWDHYQTYRSHMHHITHGDRHVPENSTVDLIALRLAFYDRYLKGINNSIVQADRVRLYISGENVWRDYPTYPVPDTREYCLYLHSEGDARSLPGNGTLTGEAATEEPLDTYIYDPAIPTPAEIEFIEFFDRRNFEIRSDVLTYTSEPFDEPFTIVGDTKLILFAASDALDTDWFARLTEVFPDGRSIAFHGAIPALRARYREGFDKEVFLVPDEPTEYRISLGPAAHQLAAGNRLRLSIYSAAFPACDPNTNTGNPAATDVEMQPAKQSIFHDTLRPSRILIPTIK